MVSFSVYKLLVRAGGVTRLLRLLSSYRQPVPEAGAVAQWKTRNTLPGKWAAPVLYVLLREGASISELIDGEPLTRTTIMVPAEDDDPFADPDLHLDQTA